MMKSGNRGCLFLTREGKLNYIFDLDGTLVDSFRDIFSALEGSATELGLPIPQEADVQRRMHLRLDQMVEVIFPDADAHRVIERFRAIYDSSGYPNTRPYPGVERTIMALAQEGCRMFVATNKRMIAAKAIVERLDIDGAIEMIATSDMASPPLEKADQVRLIITNERLEPARTALIGDTRGDWNAAEKNGISFILAAYGYGNIPSKETEHADVQVISSFSELAHLP